MGYNDLTPEEKARVDHMIDESTNDSPPTVAKSAKPRKWGEAPAPNPSTVQRILPPEKWVEKQLSTLESVGRQNYITGIQNPRRNPITEGASDAAQKAYEEKMKDPKVLKRRQNNLKKTNIDEWTVMAETRGADNLVSGVVDRKHKVERFVTKFHGLLKSHLDKLDEIPRDSEANREKRMLENLRGLKNLKGKA